MKSHPLYGGSTWTGVAPSQRVRIRAYKDAEADLGSGSGKGEGGGRAKSRQIVAVRLDSCGLDQQQFYLWHEMW